MNDEATRKRELDCAVLIASKVLAHPVAQGVTTAENCMIVRDGNDVRIIFEPHMWAQQVRLTFGDKAFVSAIGQAHAPESCGRGYVHLKFGKNPKLIAFWVASRVVTSFRRDRTARMKFDISSATKLQAVYGRTVNRLTRGAVDEPAIAA